MMLRGKRRFTKSTMAARVVDLPWPVGPVTSTRPRGWLANSVTTDAGRPRVSKLGMASPITRITTPTDPRWRNTLQRKRAALGMVKAKSSSCRCTNSSRWFSLIMARAICSVWSGVSSGMLSKGTRRPSSRICGGAPACRCTSEAPRVIMALSISAIRMPRVSFMATV